MDGIQASDHMHVAFGLPPPPGITLCRNDRLIIDREDVAAPSGSPSGTWTKREGMMRYLRCPVEFGHFVWSPDSQWLTAFTASMTIRVWERNEVWPRAEVTMSGWGGRLTITADSRAILAWNDNYMYTFLFDPDQEPPHRLREERSLEAALPGPGWFQSHYLAASDSFLTPRGGALIRFNRTTKVIQKFSLIRAERRALAMVAGSPCGRRVATVDLPQNQVSLYSGVLRNPRLRIWELGTMPQMATMLISLEDVGFPVRRLCFDALGERLLLAGPHEWEVREGPSWERLSGVGSSVGYTLAWDLSPDGRTVLVSTEDRTVIAYDADSATERDRFRFNVGRVNQLAFAPDGLTAAACGGTKRIAIWDVE